MKDAQIARSVCSVAWGSLLIVSSWHGIEGRADPVPPCKDIHVALQLPLKLVHPMSPDQSDSDRFLNGFIHRRLLAFDAHWDPQCVLCQELPELEKFDPRAESPNTQPKLRLQWKLSKYAKWADGSQITGWDIRFSHELYKAISLKQGSLTANHLENVIVNDKDALEFTTIHRGDRKIWGDFDFAILPSLREESIWEQSKLDPKVYFSRSLYTNHYDQKGLYSGDFFPQKITSDRIELRSNHYAAESIDPWRRCGIHLQGIHQPTSSNIQGFDLIPEFWFHPSQQAYTVPAQDWSSRWQSVERNSGNLEILAINLRNPTLADRRLRQALAHLLNRKAIVQSLTYAPALALALTPESQMLTNAAEGQQRDAFNAVWPYGPSHAEQLFAEARWQKDQSGILHKEGQPLSIRLSIPDLPMYRSQLAELLARELLKYGVEIKIDKVSSGHFQDRILERMDYGDLLLGAVEFGHNYSLRNLLHSSQIPSVQNGYDGLNIFAWHDPQADEALEVLDRPLSLVHWVRWQQVVHNLVMRDVPFIPLFWHSQKALLGDSFRGFTLLGHQRPSSELARYWRVTKS